MKFVHAADLHLDSPLRGLERYDGAPIDAIRGATRRALENLVDLCLSEPADLLLLAGDLYDGNWRDYSTGLFFAAQLSRLRRAEIPVVWIRGNHDAESQITKYLQLPENSIELSTRRPESRVLEHLGVAIHGQGFVHRAVTDDLASQYPDPTPGLFNIGLLHTCATGRAGHESYAPCRVETLCSKGYDYWALGHVHQREVLCEDPWIVFPGNPQGRHARETGAKGVTLVSVEDGRVEEVSHRPVDVVRWLRCEVDASDAVSPDDVVELVRERVSVAVSEAEARTLAARLVVSGATAASDALQDDPERWENTIRAVATDVGGDGVWIERIELQTRGQVDFSQLAGRDDAIGQIARSLRSLREDEAGLLQLSETLVDLRTKLPPELREGESGIRLDDAAVLRDALDDVERMLLPRLLSKSKS